MITGLKNQFLFLLRVAVLHRFYCNLRNIILMAYFITENHILANDIKALQGLVLLTIITLSTDISLTVLESYIDRISIQGQTGYHLHSLRKVKFSKLSPIKFK